MNLQTKSSSSIEKSDFKPKEYHLPVMVEEAMEYLKIKENGIYILETMNTGKLAENQVSEFMFVLGQPKIKGAVQMIINPIALW